MEMVAFEEAALRGARRYLGQAKPGTRGGTYADAVLCMQMQMHS